MRVILCVFASCAYLKKNFSSPPFVFLEAKHKTPHLPLNFWASTFCHFEHPKTRKPASENQKTRDLEPKIFQRLFLTKANRTRARCRHCLSERERERARSHLFFFVRSARTDHLLRTRPRVAHARIFSLWKPHSSLGKKKFKRIGEREIDFGLRVPVSFKDSLSV